MQLFLHINLPLSPPAASTEPAPADTEDAGAGEPLGGTGGVAERVVGDMAGLEVGDTTAQCYRRSYASFSIGDSIFMDSSSGTPSANGTMAVMCVSGPYT